MTFLNSKKDLDKCNTLHKEEDNLSEIIMSESDWNSENNSSFWNNDENDEDIMVNINQHQTKPRKSPKNPKLKPRN